MPKVKICGLCSLNDAERAVGFGADYLGFIFIKGTPRYIDPDLCRDILQTLRNKYSENVFFGGLFKDQKIEVVWNVVRECDLDFVQLQGDESPAYCEQLIDIFKENTGKSIKIIKAVKVKDEILPVNSDQLTAYTMVDFFVFDTFHPLQSGGTGICFKWEEILNIRTAIIKPFFIAGGLNPGNVHDAVSIVDPYGVDVSSGIENEICKKDEKLLKEFIENAKENDIA